MQTGHFQLAICFASLICASSMFKEVGETIVDSCHNQSV